MDTVKIGRFIFRYRSFTLLPIILFIIFFPAQTNWSVATRLVFLILIIFFEALRIWAVGYAGSITRTRDSYVPELVIAGPFRYVRNPLYVSNIFIYTLIGLLFGYIWLSLIIFFYSFLQYSLIVVYEENLLEKTFNENYINYKKIVPRWVFRFKSVASTNHKFDFFKAIRSERSSFITALFIFIVYMLK